MAVTVVMSTFTRFDEALHYFFFKNVIFQPRDPVTSLLSMVSLSHTYAGQAWDKQEKEAVARHS